jgi:uncharacterized OsmC-like protein
VITRRHRPCEHQALDLGDTRRGTSGIGRGSGRTGVQRPSLPPPYPSAVSDIESAVKRASAYLADHPSDARYRDSYAHARLQNGLRVEVDGPGGERLSTDMPKGIGGGASVPSPGWYFRAAAAACVASLIGIRAAMTGVELASDSIDVTVDSESDDRGILGLDDAIPAGALSLRVVVAIRAGATGRDTLEELARWAVDHCPVTDTAARAIPIEVQLG